VSKDIYNNYLRKGVNGASKPGPRDIVAYTRYLAKSGNPTSFRSVSHYVS